MGPENIIYDKNNKKSFKNKIKINSSGLKLTLMGTKKENENEKRFHNPLTS